MQQRRQKIIDLVNREGQVSFTQLKDRFPEVSEMTLRSDLKALDESRAIIRIHGGARSIDTAVGTDGLLSSRALRNAEKKAQLVRKALALLGNKGSIFLDSGSTATLLARSMPDEARTIYTSGVSCAVELAALEKPAVHLLGGRLNRYSLSVNGARSVLELRGCHFDLCFLGVTSFSQSFGFSCEGAEDCQLKQAALRQSDCKVVLMDSGKIGLSNTHCICRAGDVDIVVTDDGITEAQKEWFAQRNVTVI